MSPYVMDLFRTAMEMIAGTEDCERNLAAMFRDLDVLSSVALLVIDPRRPWPCDNEHRLAETVCRLWISKTAAESELFRTAESK